MRRYSMYQYVRSERRPCCYNGCRLILLRLSIRNALPRSSNAADAVGMEFVSMKTPSLRR